MTELYPRAAKTKLAVALRYDEKKRRAPTVVAKGRGTTAETIERLAIDHHVPFHSDPQLATLLEHIPVAEEIPEALYVAVAEVLAFAYHLRGWTPGQPHHEDRE